MQAIRILGHALNLIVAHGRQAWTASVLPVGATILVLALGAGAALIPVLAVLAVLAVLLWLQAILAGALSWHRFLATGIAPHVIPRFPKPVLQAYLGIGGLLLLVTIAAVPPLGVAINAGEKMLDSLGVQSGWLLVLAGIVLLNMLLLRLGVGLTGAAKAESRPLATGWAATRRATGPLFLLALLWAGLMQAETGLRRIATGADLDLLGFLGAFAILWLHILVTVCLLTALWNHYVEGRPLR